MCNQLLAPLACSALDAAKGGARDAAGSAGESAMDGVANWFNEAAEWAVKNLTAAWLNAPSPDVTSSTSTSTWLQDHLNYLVLVAMVGSIMFAAFKLALQPRAEHMRGLGESMFRVVLAGTAAAYVVTVGIEAGDIFAAWIIDVADVDLGNSVLTKIPNPGLLLVLALVMAVAQLIQLVLMIIKNAMLIFLVGVLPIVAATSSTAEGKQRWSKAIAWLIAFVLYKPVAALIYAGAFKMLSDENSITGQVTGVVAVLLAIFALPAMMRFIAPATAQVTAGNAGAMALGLVGAAAASGAVLATGGAGAAGGGSAGFSGSMATSPPVPDTTGGGGGGGTGSPSGPSGSDGPATDGGQGRSGPEREPGPTQTDGGGPSGGAGGAENGFVGGPTQESPATSSSSDGPTGAGSPVSGGSSWQDVAEAGRAGMNAGNKTDEGASGAVEENGR